MKYDKITVMTNFGSSGLWVPEGPYIAGGGMIEADDLNLPKTLKKELDDWIFFFHKIWYKQYAELIYERMPKQNAWGRAIAKRVKSHLKNVEVWFCYEEEKPDTTKSSQAFCVVTNKSDDTLLGVSYIERVEIIGVEHNKYYPVIGEVPEVGKKFIPKKSEELPNYLEWNKLGP